jgi:hypothetical protein
MKFRPLHDRVVIKRIDAEDKTAGGIIIPDTAKEKPSEGEVIWSRRPRRQGQPGPDRAEGGRPCPVRKMVRHRSQARRRRLPDHERERHHGRARSIGRPAKGRVSAVASLHNGEEKWLLKK